MQGTVEHADSDAGDEMHSRSPHVNVPDADGVNAAHDSELRSRAIVRLNHECARLTSFEVELRNAVSTGGSIDRDLVHELRGTLHAIVLQVESIKEDLEHDDDDLPGEIEELERQLARSRESLAHFLAASEASTPDPEALG